MLSYGEAVRAAAFGAAFAREHEAHFSASNEPHPHLRRVEALAAVDVERCESIARAAEAAALRLDGQADEGPASERV